MQCPSIVPLARAVSATMLITLALLLAPGISAAKANSDEMLLITRDLDVRPIELLAIDNSVLRYRDAHRRTDETIHELPIDECVAVFRPGASIASPRDGVAELADGQRLPGRPAPDDEGIRDGEDQLAWWHPRFGRLTIELDQLASVRFTRDAPMPDAGASDVVRLKNGDEITGFLLSLGDPVRIEPDDDEHAIDDAGELAIPRDRIASVRLVTPARESDHRRVWLRDGTRIDVREVKLDRTGAAGLLLAHEDAGTESADVPRRDLTGVLFDPARLRPLAELDPQRVQGPPSRYRVPEPRRLSDDAVLGLAAIEFRGPMQVFYALPNNVQRFAARAVLPESGRQWADFRLRIRVGDETVFDERLHAGNPEIEINVPVDGSEPSIEIHDGRYGPVRNHLILDRAMLLIE